MPQETVLLYNFSGTEAGQKLKSILLKMRVRIRLVEPESYLEPVGFLAGIKGIDSSGLTYSETPFPEQMLIMRGFTGSRIDELLRELKKHRLPPIPLKAVVTENNQYWNSLQLREELIKEHEAMTRMAQERKNQPE